MNRHRNCRSLRNISSDKYDKGWVKKMIIVEKVIGNLSITENKCRTVDKVRLTHDELLKPHQKLTSEEGTVVGLSLSVGAHLHNGDILYMDDVKMIAVDLKEEEIFEIRPKNNIEWAKAAFNIGNMHQKAYLYDDCIRVPYDYVLERMFDSLGVEYSREIRKLDGILANIAASYGHHNHNHDHQHDHDHDHAHDFGRPHDHDHDGAHPH